MRKPESKQGEKAVKAEELLEKYRHDIQEAAEAMERTMRVRRVCAANPQQYAYKKVF